MDNVDLKDGGQLDEKMWNGEEEEEENEEKKEEERKTEENIETKGAKGPEDEKDVVAEEDKKDDKRKEEEEEGGEFSDDEGVPGFWLAMCRFYRNVMWLIPASIRTHFYRMGTRLVLVFCEYNVLRFFRYQSAREYVTEKILT